MEGQDIKGHEDLLAAARLVLDQQPDVRFLVVGDGFDEAGARHFRDIRRLAGELGIQDAVIFAGRRRDLVDVLASMDVSVQCSLSENYGGTIESLLMERPTVATRVGGMPEVVIDEQTGLLVPARDPEALAAAILRLVDDPELGRRLGRKGRVRVLERHTIQHTIDHASIVCWMVWRSSTRTRPFGEPTAELGIIDEPQNGCRERLRIPGRHQQPCLLVDHHSGIPRPGWPPSASPSGATRWSRRSSRSGSTAQRRP